MTLEEWQEKMRKEGVSTVRVTMPEIDEITHKHYNGNVELSQEELKKRNTKPTDNLNKK
jgi:hypothetical protein